MEKAGSAAREVSRTQLGLLPRTKELGGRDKQRREGGGGGWGWGGGSNS